MKIQTTKIPIVKLSQIQLNHRQLFQLLLEIALFLEHTQVWAVANQTFCRTFRNSNFFETHVHLGTFTVYLSKKLESQKFLRKF